MAWMAATTPSIAGKRSSGFSAVIRSISAATGRGKAARRAAASCALNRRYATPVSDVEEDKPEAVLVRHGGADSAVMRACSGLM